MTSESMEDLLAQNIVTVYANGAVSRSLHIFTNFPFFTFKWEGKVIKERTKLDCICYLILYKTRRLQKNKILFK